jgi:hypothetical protein
MWICTFLALCAELREPEVMYSINSDMPALDQWRFPRIRHGLFARRSCSYWSKFGLIAPESDRQPPTRLESFGRFQTEPYLVFWRTQTVA